MWSSRDQEEKTSRREGRKGGVEWVSHLCPWDFNLWRCPSGDMERSRLLNEELITFPERRGHAKPCRATQATSGWQEAGAGGSGEPRPEPLLGFLRERKDRTG